MMNLEEAREHLLSQIELQMCRIHVGSPDAPKKLREFYDFVEGLPISHHLFQWYLMNSGKILIEYCDGEVRVIKTDNQEPEEPFTEIIIPNIYDDFIRQAFDNQN